MKNEFKVTKDKKGIIATSGFNLSEKIEETFPVKEVNGKIIKWHGKDIQIIVGEIHKEFIKRLKEALEDAEYFYSVKKIIDKLAGKKLI